MVDSFYDLQAKDKSGNIIHFSVFKGHLIIVSNIACRCNLTAKNYKSFNELDKEFGEKGLKFLLFPCNQFFNQDTGGCIKNLDSSINNKNFVMFSRVNVFGSEQHPVFGYLTENSTGFFFKFVKWNFTKWLIDKSGKIVKRYGPNELIDKKDVEKCLNE